MLRRSARVVSGAVLALAATVAVSGCSGDVRAAQVEDSIRDALVEEGVALTSVDCPAGVPAKVHATITCGVQVDGTDGFGVPVDRIKVVVTSVDGDQVRYRLEPIAAGHRPADDEAATTRQRPADDATVTTGR